MKLYFNADEVFEMAEDIERQGASFYTKAAGLFSDADIKNLLEGLSKMEISHEKAFKKMRSDILNDAFKGYDPDEMAIAYIHAFTEGKVFAKGADMCDALNAKSTLSEILKMAIEAEKNSILFYTGIKKALPETMAKDAIEDIIAEEMKHIVMLTGKLTSIA
jgi:rubrerythrin